ncbi:MAG: nodulation protein NfeD [Elusimicrobia bacterium]|nr:nodulation protein NfeD [Elusimicrobiota bacterium]MDE2314573.1 nodulation protein NfeD [Elusimicrobiota bacterium]
MRFSRLFLTALLACPALACAAPPRILLARYAGVISPPAAEYFGRALAAAQQDGDNAAVIELDTPGGLDASMREIVQAIFASRVPVVVYVAPQGARAASAGVFITMAASIAAMAPGTNIGAAHPVELGGFGAAKPSGTEAVKIKNDAAAYLRAIAQKRGRNQAWAAEAVAQSVSITAEEAVRKNVVDLEADDLPDLLKRLNGRKIPGFSRPLETRGAAVAFFPMSGREKILCALADPSVAAILMTLGVSGLLIEFYHPGLVFPGAAGAAALILAFYSFQTLSVGAAGFLLLGLGLVLFLLEFKFHGFGLLALSGAAAATFGVAMLFRRSGMPVPWISLAAALAVLGAAFAALAAIVGRALGRRPATGAEGLVGARGLAETDLDPEGKVLVEGALWDARSTRGRIARGSAVEVAAARGLFLEVRPRGEKT